jgi:hypothetical protein
MTASRVIIYAWVNDENTLRKAGARPDSYVVFRCRLEVGDHPNDGGTLLAETIAGNHERNPKRWPRGNLVVAVDGVPHYAAAAAREVRRNLGRQPIRMNL